MSEDKESKSYDLGGHYTTEIVIIIFVGVILWSIGGMLAGYEIFNIHEWGMYWFIAIIILLPVVILVAVAVTNQTPKYAYKRNYQNPRRFAQIAVSFWLLISFTITLIGFVNSASN